MSTEWSKRIGVALGLVVGLAVAGCASDGGAAAEREEAAPGGATPALELPAAAAPDAALEPLSFLSGRWTCVNPNGTVNDELWTAPRGSSMAALFRQVRRDGRPGLFEVTLITAEEDGVFLRLRHLHGALEIPEGRAEVSLFRLVAAAGDRAEFAGTGAAEQVQSVVYRLDGPDALVQEVRFAPESGEGGYTLRYARAE